MAELAGMSKVLRLAPAVLLVALAGCSAGGGTPSLVGRLPEAGDPVTVQLSSFAFDPAHLRLRAGVPVRLRFVNRSSGSHDFSAPAFFAASAYPPGTAQPQDGTVELAAGQSAEIALVPMNPGSYPVICTHPLHELFGMTGTVEVVGSGDGRS